MMLAYPGGLDSSVALRWIKEKHGFIELWRMPTVVANSPRRERPGGSNSSKVSPKATTYLRELK
jgi:argininosuccinate synthase